MPFVIPINNEFSSLAEHAYVQIKQKIFSFEILNILNYALFISYQIRFKWTSEKLIQMQITVHVTDTELKFNWIYYLLFLK